MSMQTLVCISYISHKQHVYLARHGTNKSITMSGRYYFIYPMYMAGSYKDKGAQGHQTAHADTKERLG